MFIRNREEALDAVAQILDLPERRDQIVRSTIQIMACLQAEPRELLINCQALLIEGGLEALRRRREEALDPIVILDPEEDRLFEAVASARDALRLATVAQEAAPGLPCPRWEIARALREREVEMRDAITGVIRGRGRLDPSPRALAAIVASSRPAWASRAGAMRSACFDVLTGAELASPGRIEAEAGALFEIMATCDEGAAPLLAALDSDPMAAVRHVARFYELLSAVRAASKDSPSLPEGRPIQSAA